VGVIAPLAALPLLVPGYLLLWIPMTALYLISNASGSGLLNSWRMAPFLPLLWGSIAVLIVRLRPRWAYVCMTALLLATLIGFLVLSPFPGGAKFEERAYQVDEHTRIGEQIVAGLPHDVPLTAQNGLAAHLATRPWMRLFPWYDATKLLPSIVVLDEKSNNTWPLKADELKAAILSFQMDPAYETAHEQDGYYAFQLVQEDHPLTQPVSKTWSSTLSLTGYELAQAHGNSAFTSLIGRVARAGKLRVILQWTALQAMPSHLVISIRLVAPDGRVVAQDDSWPGRGALPTPLWEVGRSIRDTHYLDIPADALPDQLTLQVIVYAADTLDPIDPAGGFTLTTLSSDNTAP